MVKCRYFAYLERTIRIVSNIIQTLWIGDTLSTMELISLNSFVKNNMEIHLYCYENIKNVPEGVIVKNGSDILPKEDIFSYQVGPGKGSFSAFSNYFRYKLLYEKGGWWVDTDMVCLQPWDFEDNYVFCSEEEYGTGLTIVNTGAIKCPSNSAIMGYCYNECLKQNKDTLEWGTVGPKLLAQAVNKFNYKKYVKPTHTFSFIAPFRSNLFIEENKKLKPSKSIYGLHLWNEAWRRLGIDKHGTYPSTSIYEQLKAEYV